MKTAMQEFLSMIESKKENMPNEYWAIEGLQFVEKEKQQIMESFVAGSERGLKDIPFNAEQYYTQTFEQKKGFKN